MESRIVSRGKVEPREGLVEQGRALVRLAYRYADALDAQGWSQDATAELDLGIAKLESEEARVVSRQSEPADPVHGIAPEPPDAIDGAFARELVRRAAPKIAGYLEKMRGAAAALDQRLDAGSTATDALTAVERALEHVSAPTEAGGKGEGSTSTLSIYATQGHVLDLMETLIEVAGIAFEGQPDVRSKFNLELLEQARRNQGRPAP